jgi:hypothetical protein
LNDLANRRAQFMKMVGQLKFSASGEAIVGKGRVLVGKLDEMLGTAGVKREEMFDYPGLMCLRRTLDDGRYYFIANRGQQVVDGWVPLAVTAKSVVLMNAMSGVTGVAPSRTVGTDQTRVRLQLQPGESVILRVFSENKLNGPAWPEWQTASPSVEIKGRWRVEFFSGRPALPPVLAADQLKSWTELGGEAVQNFAGTARYSISFDAPDINSVDWQLSLGKVCQSACVRLNGRELGTLITPPFQVVVRGLKPKGNKLEVEVTNVSANAIRHYDREDVSWKTFHDINFVNLDYRPFDASNWPLTDSGLLGPVTLTALRSLNPLETQ